MPIFLSVFVGIRQMANLPVESMKTGGLAWFTDLTVPDPYFALPVMTVGMLYVTIEVSIVSTCTSHVLYTLSHKNCLLCLVSNLSKLKLIVIFFGTLYRWIYSCLRTYSLSITFFTYCIITS